MPSSSPLAYPYDHLIPRCGKHDHWRPFEHANLTMLGNLPEVQTFVTNGVLVVARQIGTNQYFLAHLSNCILPKIDDEFKGRKASTSRDRGKGRAKAKALTKDEIFALIS